MSPLYGKLSDLIGALYSYPSSVCGPVFKSNLGRKPILFASIAVFLVSLLELRILTSLCQVIQFGSALCGAAQNMTWLVVARAVQGMGGGGIIQLVQITISDIVSLQEYVSFVH